MKKEIIYDVIIVGGGPAGLSVGSIISRDLKVLLIEKNYCGKTTRAWATWSENAKKLPILHHAKKAVFSSYKGTNLENKDAGTFTVNEAKILDIWLSQFLKNGGQVQNKCNFISYKLEKNRIKVKTGKGVYSARLLIDACGDNSPIIKKNFAHQDDHYWSCFGYVTNNIQLDASRAIILEDVFKQKPRPYFMYFPISKNRGVPIVFFLGEKRYPKRFMKKKFFEVTSSKEYKEKFRNAEFEEEKHGYIPLRNKVITHKDRVLFIGDAAGWAPPLSGAGFNEIVEKYEEVGKSITTLFQKDDFSDTMLNSVFKLSSAELDNYMLQSIAYHLVRNFNDEDLNQLIGLFHKLNKEYEENFIKGTLTPVQIVGFLKEVIKSFPLQKLAGAIPKKEYLFLAEFLGRLGEDLIVKEIESILKN